MKIEQKDGYTLIDKRGNEPCRACGIAHDDFSTLYGRATMGCVTALNARVAELEVGLRRIRDLAKFGSATADRNIVAECDKLLISP